MAAATAIAAIIAAHVMFVLLGANPDNGIVHAAADWSATLAAWFKDLFTPSDPKMATFLNYGLAAVCYLFVGGLLHRLLTGSR